MAKTKSYTPEFKQQIVDLRIKAGKGITELSNEYGVPKGTISTCVYTIVPFGCTAAAMFTHSTIKNDIASGVYRTRLYVSKLIISCVLCVLHIFSTLV